MVSICLVPIFAFSGSKQTKSSGEEALARRESAYLLPEEQREREKRDTEKNPLFLLLLLLLLLSPPPAYPTSLPFHPSPPPSSTHFSVPLTCLRQEGREGSRGKVRSPSSSATFSSLCAHCLCVCGGEKRGEHQPGENAPLPAPSTSEDNLLSV